ncbi:MAG: hypothetical protein AB1918_13380, partial [Pseudomonadota bacterium]
MLKPQQADIAPISRYDDLQFGNWLRVSLEGYYAEKKGRMAFRPMHSFVGRDYSLAADLAAIYDALDITSQAAFRGGVAICLAQINRFLDVSSGFEYISKRGRDQIDHGDEGGGVAVAPGPRSGCLEQ